MNKKFTKWIAALALLVFMMPTMAGWGQTDVIDHAATESYLGNTGTSSWATDFSITGTSGAVYYIHSMGTKNTQNALQWNANGYLYMTTTCNGKKLKSVTITTTANKNIGLYAKNEAYSAAPSGTALATIAATSSGTTYTFNGDYTYLALKGTASSTSITSISIEWETPSSVATPTFNPTDDVFVGEQSVTINCETTGTSIYYTLDGVTPTASSTLYTEPIQITETTTIKAIAIDNNNESSSVATKTYTKLTPLTTIQDILAASTTTLTTVAVTFGNWVISGVNSGTAYKAFLTDGTNGCIINENEHGFEVGNVLSGTVICSLIRNGGAAQLQGVKSNTPGITVATGGTVTSREVTYSDLSAVNTGSVVTINGLTYDGTTTLKDANNNSIILNTLIYTPSSSDLESGKTYNITGVFEWNWSNRRILPRDSYDIQEVVSTDPAINADNVTLAYDATSGSIAYTIDNPVESQVLSASITGGNEGNWLTLGTVGEASIPLTCSANEGDADRTATVTLTYQGAANKVITVTQEHFVIDYAELPFEFNGGKNDIENTVGLTQNGLGSDYSSSPKLKFDGTGDWVILKINEVPGTLTFDIKNNSFSGGTFKVQTSEDGENYSDLKIYTTITDTQHESFDNLDENVRYIKWIYTNKLSGNVGLGKIALAKALVSVATPTFSPEGGVFTEAQNVTIACTTEGATIYYTTDGTDPTTESTEYTAAIPVATTTSIKAIAVKAGMTNSEIATATYTISSPAITLNSYSIEAPEAGDSGILEATYHNITEVAADVWFCNAEGAEEAEYGWITANINDDNNVAYTINSNTGDARTAYFKVYALDDDFNYVYSNLVTVTQAGAAPKYNVLFEVNGGTFIGNEDFLTDAEEKEAGTYTLPSATKEGFTFAGWLLDGTETIYASGEHYEVTTDALFTAQWTNAVTATINFTTGTGNTPISNASVTGKDNANNTWNVITTGSNVYFSTGNSNSQVGSTNRPATSITFTMSLATPATFTTFNAKFGGSAGASRGTITIKVGERVIGTGNINGTTPVTVTNNVTDAIDKDITVVVDEITSGILCYYFNYTYEINTDPIINPTVDPLAYNATSGTITYEIDNYVAGSMTASTEADWISNFEYEQVDEIGTVSFTTTANELYESREATVTLTFTYDTDKTVTKDVTVTQAGAPIPTYYVSFVVGEGETFVPNEDFDDEMVEVEVGTYTLPSATKEGYTFVGWSDGEQTYAAGASYTVSDDVEFTATYTELPKYTITFYVNGDQDENITISNIVAGNSTALPTSSTLTPAGFEISGWALENTTTAVADPYTPSANVALYALLQLENMPTSEYYAKVTEELTDWSGEYLIVYEDGSLAFDGSLETLDASRNTIAVNIANNSIAADATTNASKFTIAQYDGGYSIMSASNKYIGNTSNSNALTASDSQMKNTINYNEGNIDIVGTGGAYLRYNSTSGQERFRYFKSSSYTSQKAIQLYKKVSETPAAFNNVVVLEESKSITTDIPENTCVVVENGVILTFSGVNQGTASNLIIKDGGQLKVYDNGAKDGGIQATVEKSITAWTTGTPVGGWYFIASPINVNNLNPEVVDNLTTEDDEDNNHTFDLYKYVADNMDNEGLKPWYNYRAHSGDFVLANGQGYLYANASAQTLAFAGAVKPYSEENNANQVAVDAGWNLIGNPYTFNTYVNQGYYKLNNDRTAIEAVDNNAAITPCTGIIVKAASDGNVTFSETASGGSKGSVGIMLSKAGTRSNVTLDNAIVSFNEGSQLEKFYFMQQNANLYIPQGKEEYAIVNAQAQGEMPVNFRANENGQYTLTVNAENVEMNYLHLIDNMTGADIDLLQTPSYTFNAKTYDYESRFRLVFAANSNDNASAGSETFAFFANGNLIINNEGEATLQVIDMTGRVLRSEAINGSASIGAKSLATGVYVLRLVNGNNIKTQKMVMK